ncbi:MAG TPA: hypothetical protein VG713_19165 [Pirellulales bacterium]|nr:hypothetical protein [Pirellulales bacterium]
MHSGVAFWLTAFVVIAEGSGGAAAADLPLVVHLASGRTFEGQIDAKTDDERLWLRTVRGGMMVERPIAWDAVRFADVGGETIASAQLRSRANTLKSDTPRRFTDPPPRPRPESTPGEPTAPRPTEREPMPPRIATLQVEATVANWDADVETDGISLTVLPIDTFGRAVPVEATLEVELIGEGPGSYETLRTFPVLARWTRALRADDFGPAGYVLPLEYQWYHPEFNLKLGQYGLVHVTLAVPGSGTFEATASATNLRPFSPLRDRWQQFNNQRFFPNERTGLGKVQVPQTTGL